MSYRIEDGCVIWSKHYRSKDEVVKIPDLIDLYEDVNKVYECNSANALYEQGFADGKTSGIDEFVLRAKKSNHFGRCMMRFIDEIAEDMRGDAE